MKRRGVHMYWDWDEMETKTTQDAKKEIVFVVNIGQACSEKAHKFYKTQESQLLSGEDGIDARFIAKTYAWNPRERKWENYHGHPSQSSPRAWPDAPHAGPAGSPQHREPLHGGRGASAWETGWEQHREPALGPSEQYGSKGTRATPSQHGGKNASGAPSAAPGSSNAGPSQHGGKNAGAPSAGPAECSQQHEPTGPHVR